MGSFCKLYLEAKGYTDVYLLSEVPEAILKELNFYNKNI